MRVYQELAYLIHQRPYRDHSALVYLLTQNHGKINAVVSGLKNQKTNKRALLQPAQPLLVDLTLKPNLSKLDHLERHYASTARVASNLSDTRSNNYENNYKKDQSDNRSDDLAGTGIHARGSYQSPEYFMFYQYAHELLLYILPDQLPVPVLFTQYETFLARLAQQKTHLALRQLELALIDQFANIPDLTTTYDTQQPISADKDYFLSHEMGVADRRPAGECLPIHGAQLLAAQHLAHGETDETLAQGAQAVTTYLLKPLLGQKSLKTRAIFSDLKKYQS
ncbi:DNA repair protein RecO [Ostreibacterium oceani]|uniref:DNA repair protein RecO n=1 Tax=Ostreibacterium oceani TaxID=2654998 RepID=A0A6N7EYU5_9GAMM|nr:recombination protein O N-terminal domain-containing protein [Ostreibacterium oceani]MPV86730.1 hypothetical protein [Ostreibacterium oceani]